MKLSVEQFTHDVVSCGLLTAADIAPLKATVGEPDADATELAKKLVAAGKLTKYQAANAVQGKAKNLVFREYVVLDAIGAGGMGQVFKAEHRRMKRVVALKILPPSAIKSPSAVQRFQREVRAAARLEHPNVVTAHDAGEANGVHFLVTQYVDGRDLASLVGEHGPLPPAKAVNYILQAARGLAYAHGKGVVHRDVKPANLLLDGEGTIKILDLGLARLDSSLTPAPAGNQTMTACGDVMGTVDYMSPEQAEDAHEVDARADVYSLGCTLYFLLTGETPYRGATLVQRMMAHRQRPIPSLSEKRPGLPPALDLVFARMVAKNPADRLQNMHEVMAALAPLESASPGAVGPAWKETVGDHPAAPLAATLLSSPQAKAAPTVAGDGPDAANKPTLLRPEVVRKTWSATAKVTGALFGTIVAPILVTFIIKYLEKPAPPAGAAGEGNPPAAREKVTAQSEGGRENEPASPPRSPVDQAIDLLARCDLKRDAVQGAWSIKNGVLESPIPKSEEIATFRLPVVPPSEYDLIFSMSRAAGGLEPPRAIGLVLLVDDQHRAIVMMDGGKNEGRLWGLEMIDGKYRTDNGTGAKNKGLVDTSPSRVVVKVRRGGVSATCDDEPIFDWRGSGEQLSLDKGWKALAGFRDLMLVTRDRWNIYQLTFVAGGGDWEPLFNERDLAGWTGAGMSLWKVETAKGELVGTGDEHPQWIYTDREYRDFRLRLEFQIASGTNSGIALRGAPTDDEKDNLQIELRHHTPDSNAPLGMVRNAEPGKHKSLNPIVPAELRSPGEWNELEVDMHASRLRVWLNGVRLHDADLKQAAASKDAAPALKRSAGRVGLQTCSGQIRLRNIVLHESKGTDAR